MSNAMPLAAVNSTCWRRWLSVSSVFAWGVHGTALIPVAATALKIGLVRYFTLVGGDRHAAIQDIESEPIRAANERPNGLLEHRNFFCAIKPAHLVGATGAERRGGSRAGVGAATCVCAVLVPMSMAVFVMMRVNHGTPATRLAISRTEDRTQGPRRFKRLSSGPGEILPAELSRPTPTMRPVRRIGSSRDLATR